MPPLARPGVPGLYKCVTLILAIVVLCNAQSKQTSPVRADFSRGHLSGSHSSSAGFSKKATSAARPLPNPVHNKQRQNLAHPPTPHHTYTPEELALKVYINETVNPKNGHLTVNDLNDLEAQYASTVVLNKPPRPFHKNPAAFALEGCPHNSPESVRHLMHKLQGDHPSFMLSTPCLQTDSFGNFIANYVENRICANFTGLHYVAVNLGWDIIGARWNDGNSVSIETFVSALPALVLNEGGKKPMPLMDIKQRCSCRNLCHTQMNTFIQTRPDLVQEILTPLYAKHLPRMKPVSLRDTFLHSVPTSATSRPDTAPPIPDVAIHYRCGDNVHSFSMGLLRFPVIASLVPADSQFVYVLSEDERRKTRTGEASFCSYVLTRLHQFLEKEFPEKTVLVLRGALIFDDMTRLALAPTMVGTVSSFSLFPAIAGYNQVYFPAVPPRTRDSIFGAQQPFIRPGFTWLATGSIVLSDKIMKIGEISGGTESSAARVATCLSSPDAAC